SGPRVLCVPFPIDTNLFHPADDRGAVRRDLLLEYGVPDAGPLLLVASAFVRRKNQHLAVLFLRALLEEIPTARMIMVGGTPDRLSALPWATGILMDRGAWAAMSRRARHEAVETLDRQTYRRRLCSAVRAACDERTDGVLPGRSTLSPGGQELMFRTITLNATHPAIRSAGEEFRLLVPLDGGIHYRLLTGPAATSQEAPRVRGEDRLYPVVPWA